MIDYSKLSDFEINAAVECEMDESFRFMEFDEETGEFIYCDPTGENCQRIKPRDYCNNPSDAWPIIVDNTIDIEFADEKLGGVGQASKYIEGDTDIFCEFNDNSKALRAAMTVYLMMRDDK